MYCAYNEEFIFPFQKHCLVYIITEMSLFTLVLCVQLLFHLLMS
jgi:hypothetical protein